MRKLKLELELLQVESFNTAEPPAEKGTVAGHASTDPYCSGNGPTLCEPASCQWTHCQNLSCLGSGCGSGGNTAGTNTCGVTCNTNPVIE